MKKIILITGLFLLMLNVSGAIPIEIGDLDYAVYNSTLLKEFDTYWEYQNVGGDDYRNITFAVDVPGYYNLSLHTNDKSAYIKVADEFGDIEPVPPGIGAIYDNGESHIFFLKKPFFTITMYHNLEKLYKDTSIELISSNYSYTNYTENQNNAHGALCPPGVITEITSWVFSTKGITQVQQDSNVPQTNYHPGYNLNLIDHCNLVDIEETVVLHQVCRESANWSNDIITTQYVRLQPYLFNITPSPSNDYTINIDYSTPNYFSLDGLTDPEVRYGLDSSTTWYWDDLSIVSATLTHPYYTLNMSTLMDIPGDHYNTDPGSHTLSAYIYLTCDSYQLITWNISLSTADPTRTSMSGIIYTENGNPLYNISMTLIDPINIFNYFSYDTTDTSGNYSFTNIPTGAYYVLGISGNNDYNGLLYPFYNSGNITKDFWLSANFTQNLTLRIYAWDRLTDSQITGGICYLTQGTANYTTTMDADGFCAWESNLSAGTYDLKVVQGDYCPYQGTSELTANHVHVVYLKNKEVEVSGFVTNTDYGIISNANVEFWLNNSILISTVITDSNGYYTSNNLTEGNYTITISASGYEIKSETYTLSGMSCYYPNPHWRDFVLDRTVHYTEYGIIIEDMDSQTPITDYSFWLYDSNGVVLIHIDNNETITARDINFTYGLTDRYHSGYDSSYIQMFLPRYNYYSWKMGVPGYVDYFSGDTYVELTFYTEDLIDPEFCIIDLGFKSIDVLDAAAFTLTGQVKNNQGVIVPSAEVTLVKSNLEGHWVKLSNYTGGVEFTNVTEGEYWFLIEHPAHEAYASDDFYIANNASFEFILTVIGTYIPPDIPSTCNDGIQNGGEMGIDCGGPCDPCMCFNDWDCAWDGSEHCIGNECIQDNCTVDSDCPPLLWYTLQRGYYTRARQCNNGICRFISANESIASIYMTITPMSNKEWNDTGRTVYLSSCEEDNNGFDITTRNKTKKWYYHTNPIHYAPYVDPTDNLPFGSDTYQTQVIARIPGLCEMPHENNRTYSMITFQATDGARWYQQSVYTLTFRYAFKVNAQYNQTDQILINTTRGAICFYRLRETDEWIQINTIEAEKILFNMSTSDRYLFFCNNSFGEETTTEYGGGTRGIFLTLFSFIPLFFTKLYFVLFGSTFSFEWQSWYILPIMILLLFVLPTLLLVVLYIHNRSRDNENPN